ncbi:hypothetical protein D3C71_1270400 [compost metagenome]
MHAFNAQAAFEQIGGVAMAEEGAHITGAELFTACQRGEVGDAYRQRRQPLLMGKVGGDALAKRFADPVQIFRLGRVLRSNLVIQRIALHRLRAAGEHHAFATGVLRRTEDIEGAEDIVVHQ